MNPAPKTNSPTSTMRRAPSLSIRNPLTGPMIGTEIGTGIGAPDEEVQPLRAMGGCQANVVGRPFVGELRVSRQGWVYLEQGLIGENPG